MIWGDSMIFPWISHGISQGVSASPSASSPGASPGASSAAKSVVLTPAGSGGTGRPGRRSRGFFGEEMGDLWGFIWIGCWGYLVGGDWNHGVL